jgi:Protein of unknown function (DUF2510)
VSFGEVVAVEQESSSGVDPLLWALIGTGVVLVIAAVVVAVVLSKRRSIPRGTVTYGAPPMPQASPPPGPMAPGWYPDPQRQARLRWFDGRQWTPSTQN